MPPYFGSDAPRSARAPTILIVDGDEVYQRLLSDALEHNGGQVSVVSTASAALGFLDLVSPSCIVMELLLADEDGLALIEMVRRHSPETPILVCSKTLRRRDALLAVTLGANDFIAKPIHVPDFLHRVDLLLNGLRQPG